MSEIEAEWAGLRALRHVSIVRAHDRVDLDGDRAALVLAWIEGRPLHEAVLDPRWTLLHAEQVARHLIAALAYVVTGVVVDPPRRDTSAQLRAQASMEAPQLVSLPRGAKIVQLDPLPVDSQREGWFHVRVVCAPLGIGTSQQGYLHGVALPSLLPKATVRRATAFRLRGLPPPESRSSMLPAGTHVAVITLGGGPVRSVRVLDGDEAGNSGWIVDAGDLTL